MPDISLDTIDITVIRMLQEDARRPFKEIADACRVSPETIRNHYASLKERGIIRGSTIIIDHRKTEKKHIVMLGIQVKHPYSDQVLKLVRRLPGVCMATRAMGRYDIEAIVVRRDIGEIGATKDTIGDFKQVSIVDVDILVDKPLLCPKNFEF
jgi:Lrp/AsnC family transcriptional regulator for asnA, asnC and gidA